MTTSTPRALGLEPVSQMVPPSSDLPMRRSNTLHQERGQKPERSSLVVVDLQWR
jgi:hypothetical protein